MAARCSSLARRPAGAARLWALASLLVACGLIFTSGSKPLAFAGRGSRPLALRGRGVASSRRAAPLGLDRAATGATTRIKFGAKCATRVVVDDVEAPADRPLDAYMTLPAEEWIELDAKVISRLPSASADSQRYAISVPLQLAAGVCVVASCAVDVDVDFRARTLRIAGRNATLRMGAADPAVDPNATAIAQLPEGDRAEATEMATKVAESLAQAQLEVNFLALARWRPAGEARGRASAFAGGGFAQLLGGLGGRGAGGADGNGTIELSAETTVAITTPDLLMRAPSFLLEKGGGVVLRLLSAAILPQFGELIAADYRAWSRGLNRTGGELLRSLRGPGDDAAVGGAAAAAAELDDAIAASSRDLGDAHDADRPPLPP